MSIIKKKQMPGSDESKSTPSKDLSIALEIQARNKRKKMARGGEVAPVIDKDEKHLMDTTAITEPFQQPKKLYDEKQSPITSRDPSEEAMLSRHAAEREAFYNGGEVGDDSESTDGLLLEDDSGTEDSHPKSVAEAILMRKKMADGGMVQADPEAVVETQPRTVTEPQVNSGSFDGDLKENYGSDDKEDRISKIMKRRK